MPVSKDKNRGILFIILGSVLFVIFAGKFILHIIGALVALLLINYGLYLEGLPPIWTVIQEWVMKIKFRR